MTNVGRDSEPNDRGGVPPARRDYFADGDSASPAPAQSWPDGGLVGWALGRVDSTEPAPQEDARLGFGQEAGGNGSGAIMPNHGSGRTRRGFLASLAATALATIGMRKSTSAAAFERPQLQLGRLQGPQGFQGPQGSQGSQGIQGPQQGLQGVQEPLGVQGIQGVQGTRRLYAPHGAPEPQGPQGPQGLRGTRIDSVRNS